MKRLALLVVVTSVIVVGCSPAYVRNDTASLKDNELCSRLGYAKYTGDSSAFGDGLQELKRRASGHVMTVSPDECKSYSERGASEARALEQQNQQQLLQEQVPRNNAPVTTNCIGGYNGSLSCTTY